MCMEQTTEVQNTIGKNRELRGEIDECIVRVGDFSTLFSVTNRIIRKKKNKQGYKNLNKAINQHVPTDFYRILHQTTRYTFFFLKCT